MLPHEIFGYLAQKSPEALFGDGLDGVEQFWKKVRVQSAATSAACEHGRLDLPLGIHGDKASSKSGNMKLFVLSFSGVLGRGTTSSSRIVLTVLPMRQAVPNVTIKEILEVITWSFQVLYTGCYPDTDHRQELFANDKKRMALAGQPLATVNDPKDGSVVSLRGVFFDCRGDWEFHEEMYSLQHSYRRATICHRCRARKEDTAAILFQAPALVSNEQFLAEADSPLLAIPNFHVEMLRTCSMHCINLGVGAHTNGNLLHVLTVRGHFGHAGPEREKRKCAWRRFKAWARRTKSAHSQHCFPALRDKSRDFPELRTKAHNGRVVSAWLQEEVQALLQADGSPEALLAKSAARGLAEFYRLMDVHGRFLTEEQARDMYTAGKTWPGRLDVRERWLPIDLAMRSSTFCVAYHAADISLVLPRLVSYHALAALALEKRRQIWALKPKFHMTMHLLRTWSPKVPGPCVSGCKLLGLASAPGPRTMQTHTVSTAEDERYPRAQVQPQVLSYLWRRGPDGAGAQDCAAALPARIAASLCKLAELSRTI